MPNGMSRELDIPSMQSIESLSFDDDSQDDVDGNETGPTDEPFISPDILHANIIGEKHPDAQKVPVKPNYTLFGLVICLVVAVIVVMALGVALYNSNAALDAYEKINEVNGRLLSNIASSIAPGIVTAVAKNDTQIQLPDEQDELRPMPIATGDEFDIEDQLAPPPEMKKRRKKKSNKEN